MNVAIRLVRNIANYRHKIASLEQQLKDIQRHCAHEFKEETTHRVCEKCQYAESLHY